MITHPGDPSGWPGADIDLRCLVSTITQNCIHLFYLTEKTETKNTNPQQFKFELNDKGLIIHDTQWHDLGQYYCTTGTGSAEEVKKIYLLYQRPIILYVDTEAKIKDRELDKAITDPADFVNRLEDAQGLSTCWNGRLILNQCKNNVDISRRWLQSLAWLWTTTGNAG